MAGLSSSPTKYGYRSPPPTRGRYLSHFARDYFRPYGKADEGEISDAVLLRRMSVRNSYWLTNPAIALSTLGETIGQNATFLPELLKALDELGGIHALARMYGEVGAVLGELNTKENANLKSSRKKKLVKKLLKYVSNDNMMGQFRLLALLGVALYTPAIHMIVADVTLRHLEIVRDRATPDKTAPAAFTEWLKTTEEDPLGFLRAIVRDGGGGGGDPQKEEASLVKRLCAPRK